MASLAEAFTGGLYDISKKTFDNPDGIVGYAYGPHFANGVSTFLKHAVKIDSETGNMWIHARDEGKQYLKEYLTHDG